jgi:hypothetical protein
MCNLFYRCTQRMLVVQQQCQRIGSGDIGICITWHVDRPWIKDSED